MDLPLSPKGWDYLGNVSLRLRQTYNDTMESVSTGSSKAWAEESFKIVQSFAYQVEEDLFSAGNSGKPSEAYLTKSRAIAEKQLLRGGMRLAQVMSLIFSD